MGYGQRAASVLSPIFAMCILFWVIQPANSAPANWAINTSGPAGPLAYVRMGSSGNLHTSIFIVFEYKRQCDPIFSYMEFSSPIGAPLGAPTNAYRIDNSNVGVIHNGTFYTWYTAKIHYSKGFEVGFGVTLELWKALTGPTTSLSYVREDRKQFQLPISGLREKLLQAMNYCLQRVGSQTTR